jgi:hypothetical protein
MSKFKNIIAIFVLVLLSVSNSLAKEKLYIVNTGSSTGNLYTLSLAYANDLKDHYEIEFIQGKGCIRSISLIKKLDGPVLYVWHGLDTMSALVGLNDSCYKMPEENNFIKSFIAAPVLVTNKDNISNKSMVDDSNLKIAISHPLHERWFKKLARLHNKKIDTVVYTNAEECLLAAINKEVDMALVSVGTYTRSKHLVRGLFNLDKIDNQGLPAISSVTTLTTESLMSVHLMLAENISSNEKLRLEQHTEDAFRDKNSNLNKWLEKQQGFLDTKAMNNKELIILTKELFKSSSK